jgi:hypothetical protein
MGQPGKILFPRNVVKRVELAQNQIDPFRQAKIPHIAAYHLHRGMVLPGLGSRQAAHDR